MGHVLVNANVRTMTSPEARATAMAWHEDTLVYVGDNEGARDLAQTNDWPVEDLQGKVVLPGFVDAHTHFLHVGVKHTRPDLRGCTSKADALARLGAWLEAHAEEIGPSGIIADGWDEGDWGRDGPIVQSELNELSPDVPLVARRICGHIAVANKTALPAIWANWPDAILVNQETGVLLEQPSLYLNDVMPASPAVLEKALQIACRTAHELGVTTVGDYEQAPLRDALLRGAATGTLTVRVACSIYTQQLEAAIASGFRTGRAAPGPDGDSPWLQDAGLKIFHDGSLGGHSALLRAPYLDKPTCGLANWSDGEAQDWYRQAHAAGIQIHAHAIGDGAIDQGLASFSIAIHSRPDASADQAQQSDDPGVLHGFAQDGTPLRHRFEHYEIVHDEQIAQTAKLGIVASSQPNFVGEWSAAGGMYEERLGARYTLNNRFRSFKKAGLRLAFGSDGMPLGPLYGVHCAIHHPVPEQRLTPEEAVWHYTHEAAWSLHMEQVGSLSAGQKADFLVLEQKELDDTPQEWILARTYSGGTLRCSQVKPNPFDA